jgi:hypothetical protein
VRVDLWQIPILVMAGIVILEFIGGLLFARKRAAGASPSVSGSYLRIAVHAGLAVAATGLLILMFFIMGTSTGAKLTTLASMVLEVVALRLAYQSIQNKKAQDSNVVEALHDPLKNIFQDLKYFLHDAENSLLLNFLVISIFVGIEGTPFVSKK